MHVQVRVALICVTLGCATAQELQTETQVLGPAGQFLEGQINIQESMANAIFSSDGKRLAVLRQELSRFAVTLDGVKSELWDQTGFFSKISSDGGGPRGPALIFSPDGSRLAYIARQGTQVFLVVGDQKIPIEPQDIFHAGRLYFSRDGRRYAMIVENAKADQRWLVVDGQKTGRYGQISGLVFSEDSKHLAYVVNKSGIEPNNTGATVVVDGKSSPVYQKVQDLLLSADGRHVVYTAQSTGGWQVIVDGKPYPGRYAGVSQLQMSSDGSHVAFIGSPTKDGVNFDGTQAVIDGKPGKIYPSMDELKLSPDGSRHAYRAMVKIPGSQSRFVCVIDGNESSDYPGGTSQNNIAFSPDSKSVAVHMGGTSLLIDGKEVKTDGFLQGLSFRAGTAGPALAYKTKGDDNVVRVAVNGTPGPPLASANLSELSFSPDGMVAAYPAKDMQNKPVLVVGDRVYPMPGPQLDRIGSGRQGTEKIFRDKIVFSPDGKHFAYASAGKIFLDGKEGPFCRPSMPVFSLDGAQFAFACRQAPQQPGAKFGGGWRVFVDGVPGPTINVLFELAAWRFAEDGRLELPAIVGQDFQRLRVTPPAGGLKEFGPGPQSLTSGAAVPGASPATQPSYPGQPPGAPPASQPQAPQDPVGEAAQKVKDKIKSKLPKIFCR